MKWSSKRDRDGVWRVTRLLPQEFATIVAEKSAPEFIQKTGDHRCVDAFFSCSSGGISTRVDTATFG